MGQPFPGIWLPREMNIHAGVTMAMGSLEAAYARRFSDYKQADVKTLIRIPKAPDNAFLRQPSTRERDEDDEPAGPFVPELRLVRRRPAGGGRLRDPHTRQRLRARRRGHQARRHQRRTAPAGRRLARHRTAAEGERALRDPSRFASAIARSRARPMSRSSSSCTSARASSRRPSTSGHRRGAGHARRAG